MVKSKDNKSKDKKSKDNKLIMIGGQALIEGIMFKSKDIVSIALRDPKGKIIVKKEKFYSISNKNRFFNLPVIRGCVNLFEMLGIGLKALNYSAEISGDEKLSKKDSILTNVFSIIVAIGMFIIIPFFLTRLIITSKGFLFNTIDGLIRIIIFISYLILISLIPDIKRVFQYHGAEHMIINCYEDKKDFKKVTVNEAIKYSTFHRRCGTSFLFLILIVSIAVFSIFEFNSIFTRVISRLIFLPLVVGIGYELLKFSSKFEKNIIFRAISYPGLLIQRITTKKPDKKMLEVAIESFKKHF